MSIFSKRGVDIAAPTDSAGSPRKVVNGEMQTWMTEVERLFKAGSFNSVDAVGLYADRSTYDGEAEGFVYLSIDGDGAGSSSTVAFIKESAASGDWSPPVPFQGDKGWSPLFRVVNDGARRLLEVYDWIGGDGEKPDLIGYIGAAGLTANIAEAVDIRGPQGVSGSGLSWSFEGGITDEDPGAGNLRANAADLSAATELFVSKVSAGGDPVASFLAGLTNSTSTHKGYLILTEPSSGAQVTYDVTGTTDAGGYVKIAVSGHSGAAALTNAALLSVVFSRTGNAGDLNGVNPGTAGLAVLQAEAEPDAREAIGIFNQITTAAANGAQGNGATDDETALGAFFAAAGDIGRLNHGTFLSTGHTIASPSNMHVFGDGPSATLKRDSDGGNFLTLNAPTNVKLSDFGLDLGFSTNSDSGHGVVVIDGLDTHIDRLRVSDFGNNGGAAGTGIIHYVSALAKGERVSITNSYAKGDVATSTDTNGFVLVDTLYGRLSGNYAEDIVSFAHELKNDARYNVLSDLIAVNSAYAIGYGQTTVGDDGPDFNAAANFIGHKCDVGTLVGEGDFNIFSGYTGDSTGSPGTDVYCVHFSTTASGNVHLGAISYGDNMDFPVRMRGDKNYAAIASHDDAANVVTFDAGVAKNFVNVLHPGTRTVIDGAINDASGNLIRGVNANVVWSPATGEFIGSISGKFHWKLGESSATPLSTQEFVFENEDDAILALEVASGAANTAGMQINKGASANFAGWYYVFSSDYWLLRVGGSNVGRFSSSAWRPETDNVIDLGTSSQRFNDAYVANGVTTTSDARDKTELRPFTNAEIEASKELAREIGFWKWLSRVEDKGEAARDHCGLTVQSVIAIMEKHGLDPFGYGFIMWNNWDEQSEDVEEHVLDDDGNVLYDEVKSTTMVKARDADGNRIKDKDGKQIYEEQVVTQQVPRTKTVSRKVQSVGDRYGFRPSELDQFIMRGMEARLSALERA